MNTTQPPEESMDEEQGQIHARIEFTANERGEVEMSLEAMNDIQNPAVHFALWLKDNIARLGEEARKDYEAKNKPRIILETRGMRGPNGERLQ